MMRTTKLMLRRETLTGLGSDELNGLAGGTTTWLTATAGCPTEYCTRYCTLRCALLSEGGRCA